MSREHAIHGIHFPEIRTMRIATHMPGVTVEFRRTPRNDVELYCQRDNKLFAHAHIPYDHIQTVISFLSAIPTED